MRRGDRSWPNEPRHEHIAPKHWKKSLAMPMRNWGDRGTHYCDEERTGRRDRRHTHRPTDGVLPVRLSHEPIADKGSAQQDRCPAKRAPIVGAGDGQLQPRPERARPGPPLRPVEQSRKQDPHSTPCKTPGRGIILGVSAATNAAAPSISPNGDSEANHFKSTTLHSATVERTPPDMSPQAAAAKRSYSHVGLGCATVARSTRSRVIQLRL